MEPKFDNEKQRITEILQKRAPTSQTISYGELLKELGKTSLTPRSKELHSLLETVSIESDAKGKGLLSVLVVNKNYGRPGYGFFTLAKAKGRKGKQDDIISKELKLLATSYS